MDKLILVINQIQDVFNTLSITSQKQIKLPQIVMVGSQVINLKKKSIPRN